MVSHRWLREWDMYAIYAIKSLSTNRIYVGQTKGRGKLDIKNSPSLPKKDTLGTRRVDVVEFLENGYGLFPSAGI